MMPFRWRRVLAVIALVGLPSLADAGGTYCGPGQHFILTGSGYVQFATGTAVSISRHSDQALLAQPLVDTYGWACATLFANEYVDVCLETTPRVCLTNLWAQIGP